MSLFVRAIGVSIFAGLCFSQTPPVITNQSQNPSSAFPVRRVALYKNGVGYFEHLGQVQDSQDVSIRFT